MDPRKGWSSLPEELIFNILARVPLIEFQRLRTVCKSWNELAANGDFLRLRSKLCRSHPGFALFLASEVGSEIMYLDLNDPRKWRRISLSFLPCSGALKLRASSGGLLLLGEHVQEAATGTKMQQWRSDLLVVNPVSKEWRKLPRPTVICEPFYTALWVEAATGEFLVVAAESELKEAAATEMFDSRTGRWQKTPAASRAGRWKRVAAAMSTPWFYGSVPVYCKPVYCDGAFYHMTWDPEDMVAEFDVEKGEWRCAKGGDAVPGGLPWGVMEAEGQVLLVEMSYFASGSSCDAALSVWELQRDRLGWVLSARVPPLPDADLRVDRWRRFAVGDGFVCATFLLPGTIVTFASQAEPQRGMIFDVAKGSWISMPDLPGTPSGSTSSLFSFRAAVHPCGQPAA